MIRMLVKTFGSAVYGVDARTITVEVDSGGQPVAALMMWLYVSAYAVLLGAAVDAERHRRKRQ